MHDATVSSTKVHMMGHSRTKLNEGKQRHYWKWRTVTTIHWNITKDTHENFKIVTAILTKPFLSHWVQHTPFTSPAVLHQHYFINHTPVISNISPLFITFALKLIVYTMNSIIHVLFNFTTEICKVYNVYFCFICKMFYGKIDYPDSENP